MPNLKYRLIAIVAFITLGIATLTLSSCGGGGGGGGGSASGTGPAWANLVTGVAASGAPVFGVITLKDSSTPPVEHQATTASDGSFAFNTTGLTAPFILKMTNGATTMYSWANEGGITNITPLTTIVVSIAAGGVDLAALYANATHADMVATAAKIALAVSTLQSVLDPMLAQYGVTGSILNTAFDANHTGLDALLDGTKVTITAGTVTITNKGTAALILSAPSTNFSAGMITAANIPAPPSAPGNIIYTSKCGGCHGEVYTSNLYGRVFSTADIFNAIANNMGGMGSITFSNNTDPQLIVNAINSPGTPPPPPAPVAGAADPTIYNAKCAACHGNVATSTKLGATVVRIQNAISGNVGGMGSIVVSTADIQAIVAALNPVTPTPAPTPTPSTTPNGATLYSANCSGCHGVLATSTKQGVTIARLQSAITNNVGGMSYLSALTVSEVQAIVTALTPSTPTPIPTPTGQALYESVCAGCHGTFATSAKGGATATRIQTAITNNTGGMGYLSTLTSAQITDIATVLATVAPPVNPVPVCGSCHAIPPITGTAAGKHAKHLNKGVACATCHGVDYTNSTTTMNAATHNNGVKNVATGIPPGWNATSRSCSNACHGRNAW